MTVGADNMAVVENEGNAIPCAVTVAITWIICLYTVIKIVSSSLDVWTCEKQIRRTQ